MFSLALAACATERGTPPRAVESGAPAAKIVCDGETTVVETPVVETTAAGVVFDVEVPDGSNLSFNVPEAGQGDNAEAGPFVWVVPPGAAHVRCLARDQSEDFGADSGYETVRIIDPDGFYRSPELGCADARGYGMFDGPVGTGEPEEQALDRLTGLEPDDLVERAAYPASRHEASVRVVRDGTAVAALESENPLGDGWTFTGFFSCPGSGLSA